MNTDLLARMTADTRAVVEQMQSQPPLSNNGDLIEAIRTGYRQIVPLAGEAETVGSVESHTVPTPTGDISLRLYRPQGGETNALPALVYFHGGGFVSGDLDTHDRPLRSLANRSGCVIIAVKYRLAPEFPFPAAPEDCFTALQWVRAQATHLQLNDDQITVGGDSAGGLLAAVVCLMCRDRQTVQPAAQILIYPNTDLRLNTDSWQDLDCLHPAQSRANFQQQIELYVPIADERERPYASPLVAPDLTGLAPTLMITAELDAQRDEGDAYAQRLRQAGVFVTHTCYPGVIHGFFQLGGVIASGRAVIGEIASFLQRSPVNDGH